MHSSHSVLYPSNIFRQQCLKAGGSAGRQFCPCYYNPFHIFLSYSQWLGNILSKAWLSPSVAGLRDKVQCLRCVLNSPNSGWKSHTPCCELFFANMCLLITKENEDLQLCIKKPILELSLGPGSPSSVYFLPLRTPHSFNIPYWDLLCANPCAQDSHTYFLI